MFGPKPMHTDVDSVPATPPRNTHLTASTTPNRSSPRQLTRNKHNYAELHAHGLSEPAPATKRPRKSAPQADPNAQEDAEVTDDEDRLEDARLSKKDKHPTHAWWWKFFNSQPLGTMYAKGKGPKATQEEDVRYTCIQERCPFKRLRSKLHGSTSALSKHIQEEHQITAEISSSMASGSAIPATGLTKWVASCPKPLEMPPFEEALVNWVIATNQPFTAVESDHFKVLLKAGGCTESIPGADTIASRIQGRITSSEAETFKLLHLTASTISLTMDGWTSNNDLSMMAINLTWFGPDLQQYRACIDFIHITSSHSGENLANAIFIALKKMGVLQKLLSITCDNADNNTVAIRQLYKRLLTLYDDHLEEFLIRSGTMRFKGEQSHIRCFAHILNLIVKDILRDIGSSTHKNAVERLSQAAAGKWKQIDAPLGSGAIAILRLIVLWSRRSSSRKLEWKSRPNVTRYIPDDVDNRWNYTYHMIEVAEQHKAALDDTVSDHAELEPLRLTKSHWKVLSNVKSLLKPFSDYTEQVSKKLPSVQISVRMYFELNDILSKVIKGEGEFAGFDREIIKAVEVGYEKFKKYFEQMKELDIYMIGSVLDPRIKSRIIKKYLPDDAEAILTRIKKFLKETYQPEQNLPIHKSPDSKSKNLEYSFLEEFESSPDEAFESDIDRFFDTPPVKFVLKKEEDQTQWIINWYQGNKWDFPLMFDVARDYLGIPAAEADVERLFSEGRDILGVRRWAMQGKTLRALTLLKDELRRRERGETSLEAQTKEIDMS